MWLTLEKYTDFVQYDNIINCELSNDILFKRLNVKEKDLVQIKDNQFVCIMDKGKILDVKKEPGTYIIKERNNRSKKLNSEWKNLTIRNSENDALCVIFLNKNTIHNKYFINNPVRYRSWKDGQCRNIYVKLEGNYNFEILEPQKLFSKIVRFSDYYSREELIERIRKYILNSIELGINEISDEYKLDINNLTSKSKELGIKLKQNRDDLKLMEYGVKLTYFDIIKFEITKKKFKIF